jgi:hypothetical protein
MGKLISSKRYLYIANGAGLSPNINGLRFYDSGLIQLGVPIYYDETNTYKLRSLAGLWGLSRIDNTIGEFVRFNSSILGDYTASSGWSGALTISEYKNKISIKKQNLTSLKVGGGTTVNNPSSVYVFKGGSINTLADIFNPINFQVNDTIFITSLELFLNEDYDFLFQVDDHGAGKYWRNEQTNMNNYVIPVNYIIYFNTSNNNNIQVSNGAIIQKYNSGKIITYKNLISNSRFDVDNAYPITDGTSYFDENYLRGGWLQGGYNQAISYYYHNSPLFYNPVIVDNPAAYKTFANRTFHSINSPYDILPINHDIQPRLMKLFGVGSKLGRFDNDSNYLRTISSNVDFNPSDGQSWVKYGVEQIVAIPTWAKRIRYGVKYLVKSDDNFRPNNFAGLSLYFQRGLSRSYVNVSYLKNETSFTAISSLGTLYDAENYTYFNADFGTNAMCQWLGPNTSNVKVRKRNIINLANVQFGRPEYLNNFQILEDTISIPTFSSSSNAPDIENGRPEYVSLQMFFAEWVAYLDDSGVSSGGIYFYEPFLYFED